MSRAEDYVKVDSLPKAYELCQKHNSLTVGGMVWLKMTSVTKRTIVDLSGLGLDKIQETKGEFRIGVMHVLRQLKTDQGLDQYFGNILRECTRRIVSVQMRNLATAGDSIYSRFGSSDILTCLMALDIYVELYHGGMVPLEEFPERSVHQNDRGALVRIIIKEDGGKVAYITRRNSKTDFPVIACCVPRWGNDWYAAVGARPGKAQVVRIRDGGHGNLVQPAGEAVDSFTYGSNTRTSGPHRRQLAAVCTRCPMERSIGRSVSKG